MMEASVPAFLTEPPAPDLPPRPPLNALPLPPALAPPTATGTPPDPSPQPDSAPPPKRRRPSTARNAADDAPSSGEEEDATLAAQQPPPSAYALARAAARRKLVADLRDACGQLAAALTVAQQAWASEEGEGVRVVSAPKAAKPKKSTGAKNEGAPDPGPGAWLAPEREALRKGLAAYGLAQLRAKVGPSLPRRSSGELAAAASAYLRTLRAAVGDSTEAALLERYTDTLPETGEDTLGFEPVPQATARTAVRRLRLMAALAAGVAGLDSADPAAVRATLAAGAPADKGLPVWWGAEADEALVRGVLRHGYGAYSAVRGDAELAPAWARAEGVAKGVGHARRAGPREGSPEAGGGTVREKMEKEATPPDPALAFPAADALTLRVKKLGEALARAAEAELPSARKGGAKGRTPAPRAKKEEGVVDGAWTKKERTELIKGMMAHGCPAAEDREGWVAVRRSCALRRDDAACAAAAAELLAEAARTAQEEGAEEAPADAADAGARKRFRPTADQLLSPGSARLLMERVELMAGARAALAALRGGRMDWTASAAEAEKAMEPRTRSDAQPAWWRAGGHDIALALGVAAHGYSAWAALAADEGLPFAALGMALPAPRVLARRLRVLAAAAALPVISGDYPPEPAYTAVPSLPGGPAAAERIVARARRAASAGVLAAAAAAGEGEAAEEAAMELDG